MSDTTKEWATAIAIVALVALLFLAWGEAKPLNNPCDSRYAPPPPSCPIKAGK